MRLFLLLFLYSSKDMAEGNKYKMKKMNGMEEKK